MHPMFKPENLYSFDDTALNVERVHAFCNQLDACKTFDEYFLLGEKAHWMLCAFWHGNRDVFDYVEKKIRGALDEAENRIGGEA